MERNILVAYYSHSGNTRRIAELICEATGGTLHEIEPEKTYPTQYDAVVAQAKKEIQAGFHPALKSSVDDIAAYDTVFIGTPNWWSTMAPPIASFLSQYDLAGKTVVPFCTHGGGGVARVESNIKKLCSQAALLSGLVVSDDGGTRAGGLVSAWLKSLPLAK